MLYPKAVAVPSVAYSRPDKMLIVEVLPAPL